MALTKEVYLQYAKKIVSVLSGDTFYDQYKKRVDDGTANFKLVKKRLVQDISIDWIDTIEEVLPNLDTIVRNPRRFIVQEEDIVDVSLAKAISTESIKHLAQHTNMISKIEDDGTVVPNRILNITKEESFEIYENRFLYTLLLKLKDFVSIRYDKIKKASATQDVLQLDVDTKFNLPTKKITYRTEYMAQLSFDEVMRLDQETLEKIERIAKIDKIITDFLASSFAKTMRNSSPVRPPITRTNVILKEPNFKKALTLWQFIETYQATGGFSTSDDIEDYKITKDSQQELRDMVTLNTMLFESLYDQHETDMSLEDAQFTDLLKAGDLDFGKDELERDEYAQKLDQEELEKEAEKEEEVKPPEEEEHEEEAPEEAEGENEETPEPEIEQEEIEKDVDKDVEVEAPPKDEPDEEEPDAEEFDQNLFDVRKLYKRPDDDKLKQEEVARVKDAIDRCLTSYRKIKQEEIEQKERDEALRRRAEELLKRAEAFKTHREQLEKEGGAGQIFLGTRGFAQAVQSVLPSQSVDFAKAHKDLFVKKGERLDFTDTDLANIRSSIEEMERLKHKDAGRSIYFAGEKKAVVEEETEEPLLPTVDIEAQIRAKKDAEAEARKAYVDKRGISIGNTEVESDEIKPLRPASAKSAKSRVIAIKSVDENIVQVGNAPVKHKAIDDILDDTFIEQRANLGNFTMPNKSKNVRIRPHVAASGEAQTLFTQFDMPTLAEPIDTTKTVEPIDLQPTVETVDTISAVAAEVVPDVVETIETQITEQTDDIIPTAEGVETSTQAESIAIITTAETIEISAPTETAATQPISAPIDVLTKVAPKQIVETKAAKQTSEVKKAVKKTAPQPLRDPWALSDTTLNQRYDQPSGIGRSFKLIDENKVQVGDVPVKRKGVGDVLDDTFIEQRANLGTFDKPKKSTAKSTVNESKNIEKTNMSNSGAKRKTGGQINEKTDNEDLD